MSSEISLISDGDGVAVIGDPSAVDLFLDLKGLQSRDLALSRLRAPSAPAAQPRRPAHRSPRTPGAG